ncbi:hypothetical protein JCM10213_000265 [Rhodosporidiobolus nylandii]
MGSDDATRLYSELKAEWDKGDQADATRIRGLLSQLKIELSTLSLLVPSPSSFTAPSTEELGALTTAREVLELGALFSVRTDDLAGFDRYMALLGGYYGDLAAALRPSPHESALLSLSLLRLLSQNRIAEFHTLLETLGAAGDKKKSVLESKEVSWVLQLERSLMSGSYSRVWSLCSATPSSSSSAAAAEPLPLAEFARFTPSLLATVRAEIAACDERAYESLSVADARTLLFMETEDEVRAFAKERGWHLSPPSTLLFPSHPSHPSHATGSTGAPTSLTTGVAASGEDSKELDRLKVVGATLGYARELESIV